MADPQTDGPSWWDEVAGHYGALLAIHYLHPGNGILNALRGDYHADDGDTHAGIEQWVTDHHNGPNPVPPDSDPEPKPGKQNLGTPGDRR